MILPEQIPKFWRVLEDMIRKALPIIPGESKDKYNNILTRVLEGRMTCWVAYSEREGKKKPNGIMITTITEDEVTDTKSLLIYCMATIEDGEPDVQDYQEGIDAWTKYAKSKGCIRVTAYTNIDYLVSMAEQIGGAAIYTFISFPI